MPYGNQTCIRGNHLRNDEFLILEKDFIYVFIQYIQTFYLLVKSNQ